MTLSLAAVKAFYLNVLQRDASDAEATAWVVASQGTLTDAQVRASIISSEEAKIFVNPIVRLYEAAFGRIPDRAGLDVNVDALHAVGGDVRALAAAFVTSQEFAIRFNGGVVLTANSTPTDALIRALYLTTLGRAGTDAEVAAWQVSGQSVSQILVGFSESPESIALSQSAITAFLDAAAQGTATYGGSLITIPTTTTQTGGGGGGGAPAGTTYTLTSSDDNIPGTAGDDTINGTAANLSANDIVDGAGGTDTLNLSNTTGALTVPPLLTVRNVEIANLSASGTISANTTTWTGLTQLKSTHIGGGSLTAGSATAVTDIDTALGAGSITVDGGSTVSITASGSTTGTITVGATTRPTGAITVSNTNVAAVTSGDITVYGGTKVSVTQNAANAVNTTQTNGQVIVTGGASTTEVSVVSAVATAASATAAGTNASFVTIRDVNAGSATARGTITKISVDSYTGLSIADTALTDLSLAHGSSNIIIDNSGLTTNTNRTLNLTLNAVTGGTLDDADIYTRLNVTTTGTRSTLSNITDGALTTLTIGGTTNLTLTSTAGLSALQTVTMTDQAGLSANLATPGTVRTIDTTGSSGISTLTVNASQATFTGGAGVDNITLSSSTISKAISLGGGNDRLRLNTGTTLPTAVIDGGSGTDTLSMNADDAHTASGSNSFAGQVTNFEVLELTGLTTAGNNSVDLAALGNYTSVTTGGIAIGAGNSLTLQNFASGGTLTLTSNAVTGSYAIANPAFAASQTDVVNIVLTNGGQLSAGIVNTNGVETIAITTADTQATPTNPLDTLTLNSTGTRTVTVSGNAGLNLTDTASTLTTVDASGITAGSFSFTSGALTAAATIKGSATGTNTVNFAAATGGIVTYTGGSGNDIITASNGKDNVLSLGGGDNSVTGAAGNMTVTAGAGADTVTLGVGNNIVNLGDGTNAFTATSGNNTYTGGSGVDTVTVGRGVNSISTGTGADVITISAAQTNVNSFSTITDAHAGARIGFASHGTETFQSAAVVPGAGVTLRDYADAAINSLSDGSINGRLAWFQYGGNTYIVESQSAAHATFTDGSDFIVKLTGAIDLSTATVSSHALLLH